MNNNLGLLNFWNQSDAVGKAVFIILIIMSIISWSIILYKAIEITKLRKMAQLIEPFWHTQSFEQGLATLKGNHSIKRNNAAMATELAFVDIAQKGYHAVMHLNTNTTTQKNNATQTMNQITTAQQLHDNLDISDWVMRSLKNGIDDNAIKLQKGLAFLASVGSTAPFIGLFGTVWGIYHALMNMSIASQQANIHQIAAPIGEALIMTALGLAVAIPAVLGNNALVRSCKDIVTKFNRFAHDLHTYFITGARIQRVNK